MFKHLHAFLYEHDIKLYAPGEHTGKCNHKYVMYQSNGENLHSNFSVTAQIVDIFLVVPKNEFSRIDEYVKELIDIMSNYKRAKFTNNISDVMLEESAEAFSVAIEYKIYKALS